MDYATGLGHRRSAASPALSAHRPATVFLRIAIIEAPPAMPQASVLGDNAPTPAEPTVHTWRMFTFRREIRLWHETGMTQRALMIRDDADTCWLACQMQHNRITTPSPAVINDSRTATIQRRIDVDLFIVSLNRLHAVARLAAEVADPREYSFPRRLTSSATRRQVSRCPATRLTSPRPSGSVRNALEHGENLAIRGGLGFASGPDGWWISYRGRMFQTQDLLAAAQHLHRAIRAAIDPEAFSDFHGEHPFIELRDPATIVKPWRPGSGSLRGRLPQWPRSELDLAVLAILSRSAWTVRPVQPTVAIAEASGGGDIALPPSSRRSTQPTARLPHKRSGSPPSGNATDTAVM